MKKYSICLIGFGNVGQALAALLKEKSAEISDVYDAEFSINAIATGSHGRAINTAGIDLDQALSTTQAGELLDPLSDVKSPANMPDFIRASGADFLVEVSPVNYETGEPAVTHIRTALECGMHAVSANKGPVVHAYEELTALAEEKGKRFLFESSVMDGAPIFSVFREALPAANVAGFTGILNSCTNIIIEKMEGGDSFDEAVAYAQSIGIAETDPSGDVDGWDAAIKVAALATVLMDIPTKPQDINVEGIRSLTGDVIQTALDEGERWKLVCTAEKDGDQVIAQVAPQRVPSASPLYSVSGTSSFVQFKTDVLPGLGILESNPGPDTTAYGLLADMLNILK